VQVLTPWIGEAPDTLTNGSFENPLAWHGGNLATGDGYSKADARDGVRSFRLTGGGSKTVTQTVAFGGGAARAFTLGAWNRSASTASSGGPVDVVATATYADGSVSVAGVAFPRAQHAWTYAETSFVTAAKPLSSIAVAARFVNQTGETYFDAVRLVETPVVNGSFEHAYTGWTVSGLSSGDGVTPLDKRDGSRALLLNGTTASKTLTQTVHFAANRGERFVLSAFDRTNGADANGGPNRVTIAMHHSDGTSTISSLDFGKDTHDWTYGERVVYALKPWTSATVTVEYAQQAGTALFDDVRLTRTWSANPSFEGTLAPWAPAGFGSSDGLVSSLTYDASTSLTLAGGTKTAAQHLAVPGGKGQRFIVSFATRTSGTNPNGGMIGVRLILHDTDGTATSIPITGDRAPHPWTVVERSFAAPKSFSSVDVVVVVAGQSGSATFDAVRLRTA
ncbi:MAG: hypothetical protein LC663_04330, partial [Actinobacteria bacterium]|nr:hypothetical protein [Actinomycetota bacterium]